MDQITDFALGKLSPEESLRVLDKMDRDQAASRRLDLVVDIVRLSAEHGEEIFEAPFVTTGWKERLYGFNRDLGWSRAASYRWRRPAVAFTIFLLFVGALDIVSHVATSRYYALTAIDRLALEPKTRGQGEAEYHAGCNLVSRGRYPEAIRIFERFLRAFPEDDLRFLAQYSLGATYLLAAHRSVGPFFPSYAVETVNRGLGHLQRAAEGSMNKRIIEEAHWLRAKGFLMMNAPAGALAELNLVIAMDGPKKEEARRLSHALAEIDGD